MRIAEFSESSNLWTQIALLGYAWEHAFLSIGSNYSFTFEWKGKWELRAFELWSLEVTWTLLHSAAW
jgi:hypothetical protein